MIMMKLGYIHQLIHGFRDAQQEFNEKVTKCFEAEFDDFDQIEYSVSGNSLWLEKSGSSAIGFYIYARYNEYGIGWERDILKIHHKTPDWSQEEINTIKQRISKVVNSPRRAEQ
jgi:hypothetical protein